MSKSGNIGVESKGKKTMEKIGYTVINENRKGGKPAKCANCGGKGGFRVTFKDPWCKLTMTLCDVCSCKSYEELNLQTSLNCPGLA